LEKRRDLAADPDRRDPRTTPKAVRAVALYLAVASITWTPSAPRSASVTDGTELAARPVQPANGDIRIEASIADISAASHEVGDMFYDGLVGLDGNLDPVGRLLKADGRGAPELGVRPRAGVRVRLAFQTSPEPTSAAPRRLAATTR
jgi:hypothetical protein